MSPSLCFEFDTQTGGYQREPVHKSYPIYAHIHGMAPEHMCAHTNTHTQINVTNVMKNEDPLLKCNSSRVSTDLRILLLEIKPNVCGKGECAHTYTPVCVGGERKRQTTHTHTPQLHTHFQLV